MKKSQFHAGVFMLYAFIIVIAALVLIFGYRQIKSLQQSAYEKEIRSFVTSLQNNLEKYSTSPYGIGSVNEKTLALPGKVQEVCFVDSSKRISPGYRELGTYIKVYTGKNVFFAPFNEISPVHADYLDVDERDNPLCVRALGGKVSLQFITQGDKSLVKAVRPEDRKQPCVSMVYNDKPENSYDVVFLGDAFTDRQEYSQEVNRYLYEVFYSIEPFASNKDKLNFYRVDDFADIGCKVGDWISCDEFKVQQAASQCPYDYIVVLVHRNKILDFIKPVRSSSIGAMAAINTADKPFVLIHEFGHAFANLADEYVDEGYYSQLEFDEKDYPNCNTAPCQKWKSINGTGCFKGCSLGRFYRPTETSVMKSLKANFFGPVNEKEILKNLNKYKDIR